MIKRFFAGVVDIVLIFSYIALIPNFIGDESGIPVVAVWKIAVYFCIIIIQFALFLGSKGATPGKMLFGLRVVQNNAEPLTIKQCWLRPLLTLAGGWILGPGLKFTALFRSDRRHIYDLYLGTKVIDKSRNNLPKEKKVILGWVLLIITCTTVVYNLIQTIRNMNLIDGYLWFYL